LAVSFVLNDDKMGMMQVPIFVPRTIKSALESVIAPDEASIKTMPVAAAEEEMRVAKSAPNSNSTKKKLCVEKIPAKKFWIGSTFNADEMVESPTKRSPSPIKTPNIF